MSFNRTLVDNAKQFAETLGGHEPDPFSLFPTIKIWGGESHVVRILTSLQDSLDLWIHDWKGSNHTRTICSKAHYGTDCDICKIDNAYGNKCKPKYFRLLLAWDYSLIGASWTPKAGPSQGVPQPINPWGVISIPAGEEKTNWSVLDRAYADGYGFADSPRQDQLWRLEYVTDVGFQPPQSIPDAVLGSMPRQIQQDIFEWISTHGQVDKYAQLLASCNGVNWEMFFGQGFKAPPSGRAPQQPGGQGGGGGVKRGRKTNAEKQAQQQPPSPILNQFGAPAQTPPPPQFQQAPQLAQAPQMVYPVPQGLAQPMPLQVPQPNPMQFQQPVATSPAPMAPVFGFPATATPAPAPAAPAPDQPAHFASATNVPTTDQINQAAQQGYYPMYNADGSFNCWTTPGQAPQFQQPVQVPQQQVNPAQAVPQVQLPQAQQFQQVAPQQEFPGPQPLIPPITPPVQPLPPPNPMPQPAPLPPVPAPAAFQGQQFAAPAQPVQNAPAPSGFNQYGQPLPANMQQSQFPPVPSPGQIQNNPAAQAQIDALKAQMDALTGNQPQQPGGPPAQRRNLVTGAG